jgi:RimJ/RimL family protein N-acetyltransferase
MYVKIVKNFLSKTDSVLGLLDEDVLCVTDNLSVAENLEKMRLPVLLWKCEEIADKNIWKYRYVYEADKPLSEESLKEVDKDYLETAYYRLAGKPMTIGSDDEIYLRELCLDDVDILYSHIPAEGEDKALIGFPEDEEGFRLWIKTEIDKYAIYDVGVYAVCNKAGELVGLNGIEDVKKEDKKVMYLGFWIMKNHRHHGYAYKSSLLVLEHVKKLLGDKVEVRARIYGDNKASIRLASKLNINVDHL